MMIASIILEEHYVMKSNPRMELSIVAAYYIFESLMLLHLNGCEFLDIFDGYCIIIDNSLLTDIIVSSTCIQPNMTIYFWELYEQEP